MLKDYYFWFSQPSSILNNYDQLFGYIFLGLAVLGLALWGLAWVVKHPTVKTLLNRLAAWTFSTGISGLVWFAFRYENTPIFGKRFWAGLAFLVGIIWLGFILKYFFFRYFKDKKEYDDFQLKSKYMPSAKR
ncbi:MAG TPA: hypothetical protein VGQ87_01405 [Patescibacteria group bacterium]|jgi:hypothetical protein|nr:hypothetical protein [Patescibacteria group bacterium]